MFKGIFSSQHWEKIEEGVPLECVNGERMSANNGKRFFELIKKREQLEGTKIIGMLLHLATSQYTVNRNYQELSKAVAWYEGDLSIWDVKNRAKLEAFRREFLRLTQNYLSSTYSLIKHTEIFRDELHNLKLTEEYSLKLAELRNHICIKFVRELRNYSQHLRLPFTSATLSFSKTGQQNSTGKIERKIVLIKEELMKWDGWCKDSRKYLGLHKEIDLKPVFAEYQGLIKDFYDWLYRRVGELYQRELEEFVKVERELS